MRIKNCRPGNPHYAIPEVNQWPIEWDLVEGMDF